MIRILIILIIQLVIFKCADGKVATEEDNGKDGSLRITKFTLEDALPKSIKFTLGDVIHMKNNNKHKNQESNRHHNDLLIGHSRKSRKHSPPPLRFHFRRPPQQIRTPPHRPGRPFLRPFHRPRDRHRRGQRPPSHRTRGRRPRPPRKEYVPVFASTYGQFYGGKDSKDHQRPQLHGPQEHHRPQEHNQRSHVFEHKPQHQESFIIPNQPLEGHFLFPENEETFHFQNRPHPNNIQNDGDNYKRESSEVNVEFAKDHDFQRSPAHNRDFDEEGGPAYDNERIFNHGNSPQRGHNKKQSTYEGPQNQYKTLEANSHDVQIANSQPQENVYVVQDGYNRDEIKQQKELQNVYENPQENNHGMQTGYSPPQENSYLVEDGYASDDKNGYNQHQQHETIQQPYVQNHVDDNERGSHIVDIPPPNFLSNEQYEPQDGQNLLEFSDIQRTPKDGDPYEAAASTQVKTKVNSINKDSFQDDYPIHYERDLYYVGNDTGDDKNDYNQPQQHETTIQQPHVQNHEDGNGRGSHILDIRPPNFLSNEQYEPQDGQYLLEFLDIQRIPKDGDPYEAAASTQVKTKVNNTNKDSLQDPIYHERDYHVGNDTGHGKNGYNQPQQHETTIQQPYVQNHEDDNLKRDLHDVGNYTGGNSAEVVLVNVNSPVDANSSYSENETIALYPVKEPSSAENVTELMFEEVLAPVESDQAKSIRKKRAVDEKHFYSYYPQVPLALRNVNLKEKDDLLVYQETVIKPSLVGPTTSTNLQ